MTSRAKTLLVALDACDPQTVRSMVARGKLPTLARLLDEWASCEVRNPYGLFVGTLWTTFFTARSAARTHFHCWEEVAAGTYERRLSSPRDLRGVPFWEVLSSAGQRVAVLDVPHSRVSMPVNGIAVVEWGCHDRHFGFHTWPRSLAGEIVERFGLHPILTVDPFEEKQFAPDDYVYCAGPHRTPDEERALLAGLLDGIERKRQLSTHYLSQGGWDLFVTVFGDSHSIGHQSWHLHDPTHPWHDPVLAGDLGDPLEAVYERLDAAVAAHLKHVDNDTMTLVLLSHGMGPHYDGTHLLTELLRRLDHSASGGLADSVPMKLARLGWPHVPTPVRRWLEPPAMGLVRRRLRRVPAPVSSEECTPEERAAQRFFPSPNNSVFGGVRINLAGREPSGRVQPGAEFDAVCSQLTEDLLGIVNTQTGAPVVRSVARTTDYYRREALDALPDLLIDWNHDVSVETVWSPKTGVVHAPYTHWRTGDHRPDGLLLATGPGIEPGAALPPLEIIDLAPSLAARLGVALPDVDGRPVAWCTSPTTSSSSG